MNSPFKFLDAYTLKDREVFFGRNKEVDTLYDLLFRTPLVLVHGLSGTGKTSLIQCGLASRYDGPEWYPFFIRRQENINTSLRTELQKAIPGQPIDNDLPGFIQRTFETYYSPVYLIFDQFEELFILGSRQEREQFVEDLKAILDAELPCKVLLVMREEYLGRLYDFEQKIPYLFDFRLRVEPMNMIRVKEVLQQSFAAFNISLEEPAEARLDEIIENVSGGKSGIELPYLQVYLDLLYKEDFERTYPGRERNGDLPPLRFTQEEIETFGKIEDVLEKFLFQQEQQLQEQLSQRHANLPSGTVKRVLDVFVTEEGTKQPVRFERPADSKIIEVEQRVITLLPLLSPEALSDCLEALEESRLLRFSDDTIELAHDKLAALIHEQRTEEQRNLIRARARFRFALEENKLSGAFLNRKQLEDLEQYLPRLSSEPGIRAFVEANRKYLDEQEAAEEQRRQRELELAEEKLETERRAGRRQRIFLALMSLLFVLAIWQWWEARESKRDALDNLDLAKEATAEARAAQKADSLKAIELEEALEEADLARQEALDKEAQARAAEVATQNAFQEQQRAARQTVKLLLKDTRQLIRNLKYPQALEKLESAADLNVLKDSIALTLLEVAYYYNETERSEEAEEIVNRGGQLLAVSPGPGNLHTRFERLAPGYWDTLETRYYPNMVLVPGERLTERGVVIDSFYMARTETTIWQFSLFCTAVGRDIEDYSYSPTLGINGPNPVVRIDWYDAVEYANWVSIRKRLEPVYTIDSLSRDTMNINEYDDKKWMITPTWDANGFRLPTEAEWEYAAREGPEQTPYEYSGSNNLDEVGWYYENSAIDGIKQTHPVAGKKPNDLGLYDMSGNAWEWCWDWYVDDYDPNNPKGPTEGKFNYRVLRGGSWYDFDNDCSVSSRDWFNPVNRDYVIGFRLSQGQ